MVDRFEVSLVFAAGVVAELLILILPEARRGRVVPRLCLASSAWLLVLIPAGKSDAAYPVDRVVGAAIFFAVLCLLVFKDEILPRVSQSNVLISTLVFWYLVVSAGLPREVMPVLVGLATLPTVFTIAVALMVREWPYSVKLFFYSWFLAANAAVLVLLGNLGILEFVRSPSAALPSPIELFPTAMCATYLGSRVFYLMMLNPVIRGRHQTSQERLAEWRADAHLAVSHFADFEMKPIEVVATIVLVGGSFVANSRVGLVPVSLLVSVVLVVLPSVFQMAFRRGPADTVEAPSAEPPVESARWPSWTGRGSRD